MGIATLVSSSSGAFGRRVGAAIVTKSGFLAGIGWNDAAAPGGGLYHEASKVNRNDKALKVDVSDKYRIESAQEFLDVLLDPKRWEDQVKEWEDDPSFSDDIRREQHAWLTEFAKNIKSLNSNNGIARVLPRLDAFRNTRIYNLIEFGRSVHAEMAAITQAAMAGISTKGSTLYVTTFPCHECVRNIIAAGVDRVLYIEPYGKSMAPSLYVDELMEGSRSTADDYVAFDSYVGISPKRFGDLFSWVERKESIGSRDIPYRQPGQGVSWSLAESAKLRPSVVGRKDGDVGLSVHTGDGGTVRLHESTLAQLVAEDRIAVSTDDRIRKLGAVRFSGVEDTPLFSFPDIAI